MSEDVKPRLKTTDETFGLMARTEIVNWIELEPTLQLMKEMADAFEKLGVRGCEYFNSSDYPDPYGLHIEHRKDCVRCMSKEVLEKYRKFLEGIEK